MEMLNSIGVLLGSSWASGINLYMTVAGLGIAQRMHALSLPGDLKVLGHPLIIATAVLMYVVEFVADKIPLVDNLWDSIHTFIRPLGGAALGYLAAANAGPVMQVPVALITGTVAMDSHLTKSTTRVAINSTTLPGVNMVASVGEDVAVAWVLYMVARHPIATAVIVILFIAFSVWFLIAMFKFLKKVFRFFFGRKEAPQKT